MYPPDSSDGIKDTLASFSKGATSMVLKLLEPNPQCRLKSLHQIKIQLFFHGFDFSDISSKKYKPNEMLQKLLGETAQGVQELPHFEGFDDEFM